MKRLSLIFSSLALVLSLTAAGSFASGLVSGTSIVNHSIGIGKLTPLAVKQLKGHTGTAGYNGTDGVDGTPGINGGFDPNKISYVTGADVMLVPGTAYNSMTAVCPVGSKVLSGGFYANIGDDYYSTSSIAGDSYTVLISTFNYSIYGSGRAYAVCAAA